MLFDTHAHLDQEEFDECRAEVVARAKEAGISHTVCIGTTAAASQKCVEIAASYEGVYAAVGIQPNYVAEAAADDWERILALVDKPGVVAIGETGLDRYWDFAPFELQEDYFDRHLRLSQELSMPFVVHMRDCEADIMRMLRAARERGPLQGIMHSFTGDSAMAAECMELGMHISFAGMVTFKKSQALRDCAATISADRLLLETDSPYLSPEPVRGKKPNEPAHLLHTAACVAEVRGTTVEQLAEQTTANAKLLFGIDG